jgi:hypothetical protein
MPELLMCFDVRKTIRYVLRERDDCRNMEPGTKGRCSTAW